MPQAIGGRYFLPRASCEKCRLITHEFETRVLNSAMIAPLRKHFGLRAKRRPIIPHQKYNLDLLHPDKQKTKHAFSLDEIPITALLPEFPPPGMLSSNIGPATYRHEKVTIHAFGKKDYGEIITSLGYDGIGALLPIGDFARLLAKVAHCMAIAAFGPDKFYSYLLPVILEGSDAWGYYIGDHTEPPQKPDIPPNTFRLTGEWNTFMNTNIVIAEIKFFSTIKMMPRYKIMAGKFLGSIEEFLSYGLEPGQYGRKRPVPTK